MTAPRVAVLGVGNLVMGDEGAGVRCVQKLEQTGALPAGVAVIDGGTSTHELLGDLEDLDLLIIIDAVATAGAPGSLVRLEGDGIPSAFSNKMSPHQHGINDLLATLRFLGRAPRKVVLHGITPERLELGMELSPSVEKMLPVICRLVTDEVKSAVSAS